MELIRSLLFVPATRERFIEKAPSAGADLICLDLEDAVAPAEKARARDAAREAIRTIPRTGYQLYVRVNGLDTGLLEHDLDAIVSPQLEGISLPKVFSPRVLQQADAYLTLLEKLRDIPSGHTKVIIWVESAGAMMQVYDIVRASPRLVGAAYGAEDFTADMEVLRTKEAKESEWARYLVATACRAAGILAIDTPEPDFRDTASLRRTCEFTKSIGFRAKFCIHPDQVATVNQVYGPSEAEVAWARQALAAYAEGESRGLGAVGLNGVMIDRPVVVRAQRIIQWADRLTARTNQEGASNAV